MKGIYLNGHGDFNQLEFSTHIPIPQPQTTEVLIKVAAAAINNTDINTRLAWYSKSSRDGDDASWSGNPIEFPRIQGADVCGEIVAVGSEVHQERIGERVLIEPCIIKANGEILEQAWYFGSECNGGFAEYTTVDTQHAYKIESILTDVELASFPCSYSTAENMLTRTQVSENDTVLITGASGGVGSAAIQLAKARGAKVIAITSEEKKGKILDIGADKVIGRNENLLSAIGENSVNIVIDLVAGKQFPHLLEILKPFGKYAVSGAIGGAEVKLDIRTLYLKDLSFFGCTILEKNVFSNLIKHIENKKIKPLIADVFPLEKIVEAQQLFLQKKHIGKIVLKVN